MSPNNETIRTGEVIAAACLATDLGEGFPFEHGLQATMVTCRLAQLAGVDSETAVQAYYLSLLMYSGCTTNAEQSLAVFGGSRHASLTHRQFGSSWEMLQGVAAAIPAPGAGPVGRSLEVATGLPKAARFVGTHFRAMCEVAVMMCDRLGLPDSISAIFGVLTERWDGKGILRRASGEEIPLSLRIVHVARDAAYQAVLGGEHHAAEVIRDRAGGAFDPEVAHLMADNANELLSIRGEAPSIWDSVLDAEPKPHLKLDRDGLASALGVLGDFADMPSSCFTGHSRGVARLARDAAEEAGMGEREAESIELVGLIHDLGRVAVHPRVWLQKAALTADEWEQVRLHAYHTERIFDRSPALAPLAAIAGRHHERLDGSGYHRGLASTSLDPATRLLAAADTFQALTEPRSHRPAFSIDEASEAILAEVSSGRQDAEMVGAVLKAAGREPPPIERPAGLTEREVEVIGLIARGLQTKQVARVLDISAKTADRHIQNAYRKIGVSTRAAATLFAAEKGLVQWGELPISQ